jgi:hypothetical protein
MKNVCKKTNTRTKFNFPRVSLYLLYVSNRQIGLAVHLRTPGPKNGCATHILLRCTTVRVQRSVSRAKKPITETYYAVDIEL